MKYKYQARTREGELQVGVVEAGSKDAAANILSTHDLFILSVEDASVERWYDRLANYFSAVRRKDFVIFTRQLSILLNARLPLNDSLKNLATNTQNPTLKEAVMQMEEDVTSGLTFSQALERQGGIFSPFFVSLVRSSEVTGNLSEAVGFLADYYDKEYVLVRKVRGAMLYPSTVVLMFIAVSVLLVTQVLPQIGPVFQQAGVTLPLFTRILMGTGAFLGKWWAPILIAIIIMVAAILDYAQTEEGRAVFDELRIRMPILGKIYVPMVITRFSNNAAVLLKGGVPMAQTIEIASQTVDNVVYEELLRDVEKRVRQGEMLSQAIAAHGSYFPSLITQMLSVGEATGQVEEIFIRISTLYGRELDDTINNITELIQPALMIGLGILTGLLFASILMPLYQLVSTVR